MMNMLNPTPQEPLPRVTKVLIIDDDPVNLKIWEEALKGISTTKTALDGPTGIALFAGFRPDLVVIDRMMPGMHGDEVLAAIRSFDHTHATRIVMHSALGRSSEQIEGMEKGADLYITKSVDIAVAVTQVRSLLAMQRNDSSAMLLAALRRLRREESGFSADMLIRGILQHSELSQTNICGEKIRLDLFWVVIRKVYLEKLLGNNIDLVLHISPDCDDTLICANREFLNSAIIHCLDAIVSHSVDGARIEIKLSNSPNGFVSKISTTKGTLFTPDELSQLFIFDVESPEGRANIGTALAWETAIRHGGDLTAHNDYSNHPYLTITFPKALVEA
jgi:DNA-binding response OmpR family regulator